MSTYDELHSRPLSYPTAGMVEQLPGAAPRVAINYGSYRRHWYDDPAEMLALEEVVRTQRLRLEAILGHVPVDGDRAPAHLPSIGTMPSAPTLGSTTRPAESNGGGVATEPTQGINRAPELGQGIVRPFVPSPPSFGEPSGPTSRHGDRPNDQAQPRPRTD